VYRALWAATAHVGLPAAADAVAVHVAEAAIPQYNVGHAGLVGRLLDQVHTAYSDPLPPQDLGGSSTTASAQGGQGEPRHQRVWVIGNSFRGVGVADSIAHGLAAGEQLACAASTAAATYAAAKLTPPLAAE